MWEIIPGSPCMYSLSITRYCVLRYTMIHIGPSWYTWQILIFATFWSHSGNLCQALPASMIALSAFQSRGSLGTRLWYLFPHLVLHCISEVEEIHHQRDILIPQMVRVVILHSCIQQFSEVGGSTDGGSCEWEQIGERYIVTALKAAKGPVQGATVSYSDWLG